MTELEKKWYKYVCSKYPFLTWKVEYDERLMNFIFECRNLNLRCGAIQFPIMYRYIGEYKQFACPDTCDTFVRQQLTKYVKMIKEQCRKDLNERIKIQSLG